MAKVGQEGVHGHKVFDVAVQLTHAYDTIQ